MKKLIFAVTTLLSLVPMSAQMILTESNIHEITASMSLEEKAALVVGVGLETDVPDAVGQIRAIERLGIPPVLLADGPAGLRISPTRDGQSRTFIVRVSL